MLSRFAGAARKLDKLWGHEPQLFASRRVFVVRNFTVEPIEPLLKVAAYRNGLGLKISYSGYEPAAGEASDAEAAGSPDAVFLMLRLDELAPALVTSFLELDAVAAAEMTEQAVMAVTELAETLRDRHRAPILLHNFAAPVAPASGLADGQNPHGQLNLVRRMNIRLAEQALGLEGVHILELDHVFAQIGLRACQDTRGARVSDAPLSVPALRALADAQLRYIRALRGPAAKCLIVDCDNTLWGGVVGEDGIARLVLGESGAGRKHRDFQQHLGDLRRRGVVLGLCSKNEEADVLEVLRTHPDCLLKEADFAAMRINWKDKAANIVSIAQELNLGLEHVVFVDDNPVECEWVRTCLPEVRVIQWPDDLGLGGTLDELALFDTLVLTDEDRTRTELYQAEVKRRGARDDRTSVDDYLTSLEMVATVGLTGPEHLRRVGQLILRTNQFNLTTRRHDLVTLEALLRDPNAAVIWLDLRDRFGANGIVGCGIVRRHDHDALIDTLLLSCRVIGRGADTALVHALARLAREMGATKLLGEYVPSKRNAQVAGFYGDSGFDGPESTTDGTLWSWDLSRGLPPVASWLKVNDQTTDGNGP